MVPLKHMLTRNKPNRYLPKNSGTFRFTHYISSYSRPTRMHFKPFTHIHTRKHVHTNMWHARWTCSAMLESVRTCCGWFACGCVRNSHTGVLVSCETAAAAPAVFVQSSTTFLAVPCVCYIMCVCVICTHMCVIFYVLLPWPQHTEHTKHHDDPRTTSVYVYTHVSKVA